MEQPNITAKNYKKLHLLVSPQGFWYAIMDTLSQRVTAVRKVPFKKHDIPLGVPDLYTEAFEAQADLAGTFDDVLVIHDSPLNTFVPHALFDEDFLGSYLQYNTKVFETDFFAFDDLTPYDMHNVYVPYVDINNFLIDRFGPFTYKNANSILVQKLLDRSRNNDERQVFAHIASSHFEIVVVQNQKLILFNSFEYTTTSDFLYYLLFVAEQLNLNPENFQLTLLGDVSRESDLFEAAWTYVRHVSLAEVQSAGLTDAEARHHFTLLA